MLELHFYLYQIRLMYLILNISTLSKDNKYFGGAATESRLVKHFCVINNAVFLQYCVAVRRTASKGRA